MYQFCCQGCFLLVKVGFEGAVLAVYDLCIIPGILYVWIYVYRWWFVHYYKHGKYFDLAIIAVSK